MPGRREPRPPREIRRRRLGAGVRSYVAVALAAAVLVAANLLAARGLYAHGAFVKTARLSNRTERILADTSGRLSLVSLFRASHPFRTASKRLLREYEEAARTLPGLSLEAHQIDMNHDPAAATVLLRAFPSADNAIVVTLNGESIVLDEFELSSAAAVDSGVDTESSEDDLSLRFDGERAVSSAILRLAHPVRSKICFTTGHGEFDPSSTHPVKGASAFARELAVNGYEAGIVSPDPSGPPIPADCDVLVALGPRTFFSPRQIAAISSYLDHGGHAMFFVDDAHANDLGPLFGAWGIRLEPAPEGYGGSAVAALNYAKHPAVRDMEKVLSVFDSPCTVRAADPAAGARRADKPAVTELIFAPIPGEGGTRPVAAAVERLAPDAGGPRRDTRIVVFGDSDFVSNGLLNGGSRGNARLTVAVLNWLCGVPRPPMPETEAAGLDVGIAPDNWLRTGLILAVAVPLAILLFGLLIWTPVSKQF